MASRLCCRFCRLATDRGCGILIQRFHILLYPPLRKVVFSLRKVLFAYLLFKALAKSGAFGYLLYRHLLVLPVAVLVSAGVVTLLALIVVARECMHCARTKEYGVFLIIDSLLTLFNLFYTSVSTPLRITALETLLTGSLLDVVLAAFFLGYLLRHRRYVRIREQAEAPEGASAERLQETPHRGLS